MRLHNTCEREFRNKKDENQLVYVLFSSDKHLLGKLYFKRKMLEHIPEYDPNNWNDSRKTTPPEDVVFRAKVYRTSFIGETLVDYECLIYKYSGWYKVRDCEPLGGRLNLDYGEYVEFRPWEDKK